ncbi:MAG TPA: hypothetical protein PLJ69_01060 [Methanothrix sp.]|jgi:predicted subunit of tRNA(5-methylaminomethyl-2-thiouridylate) methyltransferase|nr:MAG: hypothetical protein A4E50_00737 [Methanosaeta sp. PtaB.Bin087]OPY57100.1 MAG: hypothetical protein A4E51_00123 [Methanosaeta sp. PtaU1.Bin055]HNR59099.1 hypothetical protein [Methanothrix sp.]HOI69652.1 hypothetical protein [Methanothrix sp.]HQA61517.1 hypothetical protein [Methanothrix sp.]
MRVAVLFSGGKDSALASILLEPFFDVELATFAFRRHDTDSAAREAAKALGLPSRTIIFEDEVLEEAIGLLVATGYPRDGLNRLHREALEVLSKGWKFLADGTKREDRVPMMTPDGVRSLEDRRKVHYIRPLAGYGSKTINHLAESYMEFVTLESSLRPASDFEVGLRMELEERRGRDAVARIFPANHTHTRVIRRKRI